MSHYGFLAEDATEMCNYSLRTVAVILVVLKPEAIVYKTGTRYLAIGRTLKNAVLSVSNLNDFRAKRAQPGLKARKSFSQIAFFD